MATSRPFSLNSGPPIPGTEQYGNLVVGTPIFGFESTGIQWWNGPDEDLGFVIAQQVPSVTQPSPVDHIWNSSKLGYGLSLSNGNHTVNNNSLNNLASTISSRVVPNSGKMMFSVQINSNCNGFIGFGKSSMNINTYVGSNDGKSIGFGSDGNYYYYGGVQDSGLPTWGTNGDIIDVAIDLGNNKIFIRVNGGNWNGTRNEDPTSGGGSVGTAGLSSLFPCLTIYSLSTTVSATLLNTAQYSVPSGYTFFGEIFGNVGFFRTDGFDDVDFINLTQVITGYNASSGLDAKTYLETNGYWTSYSSLITSGLTLKLDAADTNSYPGSGTTWYDLILPQQNITLINSPTYTSGVPSYFTFNGSNQRGSGTGTGVVPQTAYTKSMWFYLNSYQDNNLVSSDTGGHFIFFGPGTGRIYCGHSDWGNYLAYPSTSTYNLNTWYYIALTFNTTDGMKLYLNGVLDSTYTANKSPHPGDGSTNIGSFGTGNLLNGRIGKVYCYDRALTGSEVLQNYNTDKAHFGY